MEGIIDRSITALDQDQTIRKIQHPEAAQQIDAFIEKLRNLKDLEKPFTLVCQISF